MATKKKSAKNANTQSTSHADSAQAIATASDLTIAAQLDPAPPIKSLKELSLTLVNTFSAAPLQAKLLGIEAPLAAFGGCDVKGAVALANEGATLAGALDRFEASAGRVRQRLVQINKSLTNFQTSLGKAQAAAKPGGDVAKGLAGLAGIRQTQLTKLKAKKTRTKKKKTPTKS